MSVSGQNSLCLAGWKPVTYSVMYEGNESETQTGYLQLYFLIEQQLLGSSSHSCTNEIKENQLCVMLPTLHPYKHYNIRFSQQEKPTLSFSAFTQIQPYNHKSDASFVFYLSCCVQLQIPAPLILYFYFLWYSLIKPVHNRKLHGYSGKVLLQQTKRWIHI